MTKHQFHRWLESNNACSVAKVWVAERTLRRAWYECDRGHWMCWFLDTCGIAPNTPQSLTMRRIAHRLIRNTRVGDVYLFDLLNDTQREVVRASEQYCDGSITFHELELLLGKSLLAHNAPFTSVLLSDMHYRMNLVYSLVHMPAMCSYICIDALSWTLFLRGTRAPLSNIERRVLHIRHCDLIRSMVSWKLVKSHMNTLL